MIAFVFSGGGSRGAMEAGGVKALYEAGNQPDIVVGSSAVVGADSQPVGAVGSNSV